MPSSYTTSLRLVLPATGELAGQWGNSINQGITELLDAAVAGTASISTWGGAGVAYTLSNNSGLADEARKMFIVATGSPGEAKNVICPAVSKFYVLRNDTTGGFALTLKTPSGVGISVPAGQYKFLYCDGTDVVEMFNSAGALTLGGALSVGGTATFAANPTLSAGTANQVQFLNASKVLTGSANMTFNGTDLTVSGAVNAGSVNATTLDLTNLEVTNIKAKDGTASMTLADSTGVASFSANPVLSGGTANGVLYLNGSKVATSGSALTFDGTNLGVAMPNPASFFGKIGVNGNLALGTGGQQYFWDTGNTFGWIVGANGNSLAFSNHGGSEQMRLTSTGLGIGTSSPANKLNVVASSNTTDDNTITLGFLLNSTSQALASIGTTNVDSTTGGIKFSTASAGVLTEKATIDSSGNLGIGTSSPVAKLDVLGGNGDGIQYRTGTRTVGIGQVANEATVYWGSTTALTFFSGTERMRLDSSGNLGLGVTPGSWTSGAKAMQFSSLGMVWQQTNGDFNIGYNTVETTANAFVYKLSSIAATRFSASDSFKWYVAPSGTANSAISFTQAMTLDASGNLGVGVVPQAWATTERALEVGVRGAIASISDGTFNVLANSYVNSAGQFVYRNTSFASRLEQISGQFRFFTAPSGTAGNAISFTQAMTLDASGRLLVGKTSDYRAGRLVVAAANVSQISTQANLHVTTTDAQGADIGGSIGLGGFADTGAETPFAYISGRKQNGTAGNYAGYLAFATQDSGAGVAERARITSGGDLLVGVTSGTRHWLSKSNAADYAVTLNNSNANPIGAQIYHNTDVNGAGNQFLDCQGAGNVRAQIRSNGGLANYSGNDVNLSDRREKTNFAPAKSYLDTICAIPVQTFNYIDQSEDDPGLTLGVVAQDVQAVAPELVMESNWGTADEPKQRLSIYQTDLQYALMKCIQEQQALITALTARVAALESN